MTTNLRELKDDEIVKEGDLWISIETTLQDVQKPSSPVMFYAVFVSTAEIGQRHGTLRAKFASTWRCCRMIMPLAEHDTNAIDSDKPRNIDMTL